MPRPTLLSVLLRATLALACLPLGGCASELTEIVVVVESDLAVPAQLDEIVVSVEGPQGIPRGAHASLVGASAVRLPVTVGLRPASGGGIGVTIKAIGRHDGADQVEAQVRTSFVVGRRLLVRMVLREICAGVPCAELETCLDGVCADARIDPSTLPSFTGPLGVDMGPADLGAPEPIDAGENRDAGDANSSTGDGGMDAGDGAIDAVDGGIDAGDGGIDAGPAPEPCTVTGDCDDGDPCTIDTCRRFMMLCLHRPTTCLGTPCRPGVCNRSTGVCETVNSPDGTSCLPTEAGPSCAGLCSTGVCTGRFDCIDPCVCGDLGAGASTACVTLADPPLACP